jgi:hypothetical protein
VKFSEQIEGLLPRLKNFSIVKIIELKLREKKRLQSSKIKLESENTSISIIHNLGLSKMQFSEIVTNAFKEAQLSQIQESFISRMLLKLFPNSSEIPISETTGGVVVNDFNQYVIDESESQLLEFDACPCGEAVYVSDNKYKEKCSKCHGFRYSRCYRRNCRKLMQCCHGSSFRKPKKRLYYRPILSIIDELLQHEFFLKSLDFQNLDSSGQALTDVMDGPIAKHHLNAMQQYAETWIKSRLEKESQNNQSSTTTTTRTNYKRQKMNAYEYDRQILLPTASLAELVNLLFSLGYDGAQVFKHRVDHFYPLILSILNLPPSFRKVVSIVSFILSLLNSDLNMKTSFFAIVYFKNFKRCTMVF